MKLTNRQIEAIASEILDKLTSKKDVEIIKWETNVFPGVAKTLKSTKVYKEAEKLFKNPLIKAVDFDSKLFTLEKFSYGRNKYDNTYGFNNIKNIDEIDEIIISGKRYDFSQTLSKLPTIDKIEREIVLESIDSVDTEELINKIVAKY